MFAVCASDGVAAAWRFLAVLRLRGVEDLTWFEVLAWVVAIVALAFIVRTVFFEESRVEAKKE